MFSERLSKYGNIWTKESKVIRIQRFPPTQFIGLFLRQKILMQKGQEFYVNFFYPLEQIF